MSDYPNVPRVKSVAANLTASALVVTWATDGSGPEDGFETYLLSGWLARADGSLVQLGAKFVVDEPPIVFAFDHGAKPGQRPQRNHADAAGAIVSGDSEVSVAFPREWVEEFIDDRVVVFGGIANANGDDVGERYQAVVVFD